MFQAASSGRRQFRSATNTILRSKRTKSTNKTRGGAFSGLLGASGLAIAATGGIAFMNPHALVPAKYPWDFKGHLDSFDAKSLRRGHQVYTQICAACHSLEMVKFMHMTDVIFSEEEIKFMASEADIEDGPDNTGEMYDRPGKPYDFIPKPYKNKEEGRMANNGAYPPDLSLVTKAMDDGHDYIFSLLTGYREPPYGYTLPEGLNYNPYFPGGVIAMAKQLEDGAVEYEDGTPATESQMAKDVVNFLAWTALPEMNERKRQGLQWLLFSVMTVGFFGFWKRHLFSLYKTRTISYVRV